MQSKYSVVRLDAFAEGGGGEQGALTHQSGHYARERAWAHARSAMRRIHSGRRWMRKAKASAIQIRARDVAVSVHDCSQDAQHRAFSRQVTGTRVYRGPVCSWDYSHRRPSVAKGRRKRLVQGNTGERRGTQYMRNPDAKAAAHGSF